MQGIPVLVTALVVGGLLMAVKFAAFFLTGSNAILTDALESIVNIAAGCMALYSFWLASHPSDINHPYGHGKVEFLSAALEGAMIFFAGFIIIIKSIYNFIYPQELDALLLGILLTAGSGLANYLLGFFLIHAAKNHHSMTLEANGKHLQTDAYSSAGILLGLGILYLTGWNWLDNIIAIGFGLFIGYTGFGLLRRSIAGIMDEADYKVMEQIIDILNHNRRENWIDIHNMRVIKYGSALHVDAHVTLPWYLSLSEAHQEIEQIDRLVNDKVAANVEFFLHADPCIPSSCPICQKRNCTVRQQPREKRIEWSVDNVLMNRRHEG